MSDAPQPAAPPPADDAARLRDAEHLRLLSIFHYVAAGLTALNCFPVCFYPLVGLLLLFAPVDAPPGGKPIPNEVRLFGGFILGMSVVLIVLGAAMIAATIHAGRILARRRGYVFCMVVTCLMLLVMPWGTILGVSTLIVLLRPSVRELFDQPAAAAAPLP